jgi:lipoate-protein ligase A
MQRDAALLADAAAHGTIALRLYSWSPPCLSLGFMQRAGDLVDAEACRRAGIDVVRRPTGGRAVLHWEEITYAIAAPVTETRFGAGLSETQHCIGRCLAAGLERLGIQTELSRPRLDPERRLLRAPCFASPGRAELMAGGRKLAGSAQRRTAHAFLQHGSLLVGRAHLRVVELLSPTALAPAAAMQRLERDTVTLGELTSAHLDFETLATALTAGFASVLQLEPVAMPAISHRACSV